MKQNAANKSTCGKKQQIKKSAQLPKKSKNVKPAKSAQVAAKKKKMIDVKTSAKDTVAETISFVIKGKLTPIKPTPISLNKITRVKVVNKKANVNVKEKKTKPKVQNKTAKPTVKTVKTCATAKKVPLVVKVAPTKKTGKNVDNVNKKRKKKDNETTWDSPKSKLKRLSVIPVAKAKKDSAEDEIQKQKTIQKLLKEANKALKTKSVSVKKKLSGKKKKSNQTTKTPAQHDHVKKSMSKVKVKEKIPKSKADLKNEVREEDTVQKSVNVKTESCVKEKLPCQSSIKVKEEKDAAGLNAVDSNIHCSTSKKDEVKSQHAVKKESNDPGKVKPGLKPKAKVVILKRKGNLSKEVLRLKEERRKSKLYNFWNAPKKTRVASLNALAKVQCLYENESKAVFDKIEESAILRKAPSVKKEIDAKVPDSIQDFSDSDCENDQKPFQRTLRSVPGLRAVGKHWIQLDTSSSSDENSVDYKSNKVPFKKVRIKKESGAKKSDNDEGVEKVAPAPQKRVRKPKPELTMDLKDMVVRKRMASLNASAILAASYSVEKRFKSSRSGDSSSYDTDSSDEYFAASDDECEKKKKVEDEAPKEEDRKLIEVHTTPNKKVAVILNQDTDVTITGVYVNSTTRSTHHEGYCSIAGMQYRISATSHTQTAATAVATETLLQTTSASDNANSESQPSCSTKSYTPLDALSNMQPPSAPPGIQHPPPPPGHHVMPPMVPQPSHQIGSPPHRHQAPPPGCGTSAFSSPHHVPASYPSQGHQPGGPASGEPSGYVHGYYQPAGPLITVPHGHGQHPVPPPQQPHPPPPPLSKSVSLSDTTSPSSATSPLQPHAAPPPAAPSSNGDSSDSEVIITSVTAGTKELPPPPSHPTSYRYSQYPSPGSYSYPYPAYHYPTPPHPSSPYGHHDLCYSAPTVNSYVHHPKYPTSYGRYLSSSRYYPGSPTTEMYPPPPGAPPPQPTQQVVTSSPVSSNNSPYPTAPAGPPPPPTIIETYPPPPAPPTLVETYQPPPHHYYPSAYGIPPSCYSHTPTRAMPYMNPTYQNCPCPMQSCPKNVLTGPLTGESKRSNISKDSMPLPPVALALPLEPASATGPPSPARGSAGMPPPPSPAGATYQPPPPIAKQESHLIERQPDCNGEKKRKARVGKAMVRNNMQNTMLLMCNPTQNYVKREIESPKDKEELHKKEECLPADSAKILPETFTEKSCLEDGCTILKNEIRDDKVFEDQPSKHTVLDLKLMEKESVEQKHDVLSIAQPLPPKEDKPLPPCVATVAENVKVKNMKRKQLMANDIQTSENAHPPPAKKKKIGSYKDFIRKHTSCFKINNGKKKLISKSSGKSRMPKIRLKAPIKRKQSNVRGQKTKRMKLSVSSPVETKLFKKDNHVQADKKEKFRKIISSKSTRGSPKLAENVLDNLISKNNINKTIEDVIRTVVGDVPVKKKEVAKIVECKNNVKDKNVNKMVADKNGGKILENKNHIKFGNTFENKNSKQVKPECRKTSSSSRRKSSSGVYKKDTIVAEMVPKAPRRSLHLPRWSNGWRWEGDPYEANVFMNSDEITVLRRCYPAMRHEGGDLIVPRDCVLLKAGPRKNDLPYVAKIASLWENPDDGEMMMSLLWYYRPEHTEQGRLPSDQIDEVFASKHKDSNSVACIDDKCYVLTFNEYCRYRKMYRRLEEGLDETPTCIPIPEPYPRADRQPPSGSMSPDMIFFCRKVYDFRQKRIIKNPT
ncbi:uncharacterized protein LOC132704505 [Cylas formicarius]|uniref:uncharacterized protein LOC132704505 n=1 Tax=Cylas formicarius TaxID=197179 RepID=UPI00295850CD|nr:uncharacterized protein LOC132704505 [Cylas formicarius]